MTNPTFITEEFEEDGQLIKCWIEINEDGKIVAREHGVFTVKTTRTGEIGLCDFWGRTPGMSMLAVMIQTSMREGREELLRHKRK